MSFSFFMFRTSHQLQFWGLYLELLRKFDFLRKNVIKKPWGGGIKTLPLMDRQTDGQTLKLKYCLRLIGECSKVFNTHSRFKKKHPRSKESTKTCKNSCVLIQPPHGFLMDRQTDGQTLKLKYCLRLIGECSKVFNTHSRFKKKHPRSKESTKTCKNSCVLIQPPHGFLMDQKAWFV